MRGGGWEKKSDENFLENCRRGVSEQHQNGHNEGPFVETDALIRHINGDILLYPQHFLNIVALRVQYV